MERTKQFAIEEDKGAYTRMVVQEVYEALKEKGYNPIGQIVGYLLSEDPTYITTHQNARIKIQSLDRDELLSELVRYYLQEGKGNKRGLGSVFRAGAALCPGALTGAGP